MKKKILIGSIIAVVILTLVSFTSVVGYSSVKSDSKIASPLFSIKNNKGDVSSNYLGKGKGTNLLIPRRDNPKQVLISVIKRISYMNDGNFNDLCKRIEFGNINRRDFSGVDKMELLNMIKIIKKYPDLIITYLNENTDNSLNINEQNTSTLQTPCYVANILYIILFVLLLAYLSVILGCGAGDTANMCTFSP